MSFDADKLKKIQELAVKHLESGQSISKQPLEPEVDGRWRRLSERKWEFRKNNIVMATIFHKPTNGKFSLFFKTPDLYRKVHQIVADTFLFDTFEDAASNFPTLLRERALDWSKAVVALVD